MRLLTLAVLASFPGSLFAQDLLPGLIGSYADQERKAVDIVSTPHFSLKSDQSIHPLVSPEFSASWTGQLKIERGGRYRFSGTSQILVDGKAATDWLQLAAGQHKIELSLTRDEGVQSFQLRWESEYFASEPVPSAVLGHDVSEGEPSRYSEFEEGRFLFAELGCGNCHAARNWKLNSRRGPDLSNVSSQVHAGWLDRWINAPRDYRPAAVMPICLDSAQDRADVAAWLSSIDKGGNAERVSKPAQSQLDEGQRLFETIGCAQCHDRQNNLDQIGSKYMSADALTDFIANPHGRDPQGRMPQLFSKDERHKAAAVASWLLTKGEVKPFDQAFGNAERGKMLFVRNGCASCHNTAGAAIDRNELPNAPAFGAAVGLPLRNHWALDSAAVRESVSGRGEKVTGQLAVAETDRGAAAEFDGRTFIEVPHFHRPDTMTITVWVNTTEGGSIITWGRPGGGQRGSRELRMNIGQDGKNSICYGEYNSDGGWKPVIVRPKTNLVDGKWHHIAVVRNGTSVQHFVDGKSEGRPGVTQPGPGDYTDRLLIGALALSGNPNNRFRGQMQQLSVWETALSAEQIATLAGGQTAPELAAPPQQELKPINIRKGCLSAEVRPPLPNYQLTDNQRASLQAFLNLAGPGNGTYHAAPLHTRRLRIRQYRCTACHEMDSENVQQAVRIDENGRIVRNERPPRLTGVGEKLTTAWLTEVLVNRKRNHPWLNLRMPHFGAGVSDLPDLITAGAGISPNAAEPTPDRKLADAGLVMVGEQRGQASCIACHNYRGINRRKDGVVPAPDLSEAGRTVRREFFVRWMLDPQRIAPGTSMPQMFQNLSAEERQLKIDQLWSAIVHQDKLPLPKGLLDRKTEGTRIVVGDAPVIFRMATKTPGGQVDRAINVGIPGGVNYTFDAVTCQLRYVWKGDFIDAGPAWNGRGGNPVNAGGTGLLTIRNGHSVRAGESLDDRAVRFLGYRLVQGLPVFRFQADGALVELNVAVEDDAVVQTFEVSGARHDLLYVGDEDNKFEASGERDGNRIRIPQAEKITLEVKLPTEQK